MGEDPLGVASADSPERFEAITLTLIEAWVSDVSDNDGCSLSDQGVRASESARCYHDVVEILIDQLPHSEAAAHRLVLWNMLRLLFVAFEKRLISQLPDGVVLDAKAIAASASHARSASRAARKN